MSIRKRDYPYWLNLLLAIDQLGAALLGYNCDVSISAALGEIQWTQYRGLPIKKGLRGYLQAALDDVERDHCLKAYAKELRNRNLPVSNMLANRTRC